MPELTPTGIRCLLAGKHIHLDKPPGESLDAYRALHREAAERKRVVQLGYMFRYNAAFQFVFRAAREGWLGDITEIHGQIGKHASPELRRELARFPGGGMFELGCHLVDAAVAVLGAPDRVHAVSNRTSSNDTAADNQLAVLEYPKAIATIRCNHVDRIGFQRREFTVVGTNGIARINPLEPPQLRLALDRKRGEYRKGYQDVAMPRYVRYDDDLIDLAKIIRGEKKSDFPPEHDLAVQETVLRASGRPVLPASWGYA